MVVTPITHRLLDIRSNYAVGVDLGQSHDPTAIAVVQRVRAHLPARDLLPEAKRSLEDDLKNMIPRYRVRHLERLPLNVPYPEQVAYVGQLMRRSRLEDARLFIDYTGVGRPVYDLFQNAGMRTCRGITITSGHKAERNDTGWSVPKVLLVSRLQALLHSGALEIDGKAKDAAVLLKELQDFRVSFTAVGNPTFNARQGAHDDLVLALAIAVFGADVNRDSVEPFRMYRPMLATSGHHADTA